MLESNGEGECLLRTGILGLARTAGKSIASGDTGKRDETGRRQAKTYSHQDFTAGRLQGASSQERPVGPERTEIILSHRDSLGTVHVEDERFTAVSVHS